MVEAVSACMDEQHVCCGGVEEGEAGCQLMTEHADLLL